MNILFFTKGDKAVPSSRYRVWFVAERLQKQYGWNYEILHSIGYSLLSLRPSRFRLFFSVIYSLLTTNYKLIFVHKSLFPWDVIFLIICAKKLLGKKLIYDIDDAEWIHSPQKSIMLAKNADTIFCGSHEILTWAQAYNPHCVFLPTVLDADMCTPYTVAHAERGTVTIGWTGQGKFHFKAGNFTLLRDVFRELAKRGIQFRFVIVGFQQYQPLKDFFSHEPYTVLFIDSADWIREDAVPKLIHEYSFDVGVLPMDDTPFNRAKCAFKALEYMACGVPVVASPVGEASYIVRSGDNGYVASTFQEWIMALEKLIKDVSLRKRMGQAGQNYVYEQYSFQKNIPRIYAELIK